MTGGLGSTAPDASDHYIELSGPLDETGVTENTTTGDTARFWYAHARNGGPTGSSFKVFAICSRTSDAVVATTTFIVPSGSAASRAASVRCQPGRRVVGGGVGTLAAAPNSVLQLNGPLGPTGLTAETTDGVVAYSWYAYVLNLFGVPRRSGSSRSARPPPTRRSRSSRSTCRTTAGAPRRPPVRPASARSAAV